MWKTPAIPATPDEPAPNEKTKNVDLVNQPPHYKVGGIETIDYLKAKLSPEAFRGFLQGNALKYLSRAGHKDNPLQDFEKSQWYTNRLIAEIKNDGDYN